MAIIHSRPNTTGIIQKFLCHCSFEWNSRLLKDMRNNRKINNIGEQIHKIKLVYRSDFILSNLTANKKSINVRKEHKTCRACSTEIWQDDSRRGAAAFLRTFPYSKYVFNFSFRIDYIYSQTVLILLLTISVFKGEACFFL